MFGLLATAATFNRGTSVKLAFVALAFFDFVLTLLAVQMGFTELNPFVNKLLDTPGYWFMFKIMGTFFLAWLVPSRLLIPSLAFLSLVMAWDVKELIIAFIL